MHLFFVYYVNYFASAIYFYYILAVSLQNNLVLKPPNSFPRSFMSAIPQLVLNHFLPTKLSKKIITGSIFLKSVFFIYAYGRLLNLSKGNHQLIKYYHKNKLLFTCICFSLIVNYFASAIYFYYISGKPSNNFVFKPLNSFPRSFMSAQPQLVLNHFLYQQKLPNGKNVYSLSMHFLVPTNTTTSYFTKNTISPE